MPIRIPPLGGDGEVAAPLVGIVNFPDPVLGVFYFAWRLSFPGRVLGAYHFPIGCLVHFIF